MPQNDVFVVSSPFRVPVFVFFSLFFFCKILPRWGLKLSQSILKHEVNGIKISFFFLSFQIRIKFIDNNNFVQSNRRLHTLFYVLLVEVIWWPYIVRRKKSVTTKNVEPMPNFTQLQGSWEQGFFQIVLQYLVCKSVLCNIHVPRPLDKSRLTSAV